ncbi:MAG: pitrilysin family protein [Campylobacterales bacterium]|nr:pitrilysin family protein [Campylobacterales bacterium]
MASSLPKYHTQTLKNGLEVVVIPILNNSNVVSTNIFYKVGSGDEIMGKSGIAHMLEHLNFKSTKNLKAGEFDEIVKGFGGLNNASTGFDYTHYYIKSASSNLEKSLELFSELMSNLNLKDEEFQPERDVVLEERLWRTDNSPIGFLYFNLFNHAFIYHPYHWTPIGFIEDIKNWTIEDIKAFHETYYQPKNAIVVISGDINKDEAFTLVKKNFENIENRAPLPVKHEVEPEQKGAKRVEIFKDSEVELLALSYKIPNFKHQDQVALSAISELLSNGKSSYLNRILIDEKKLVNQIYAYNLESKDPSLFLFLAVCNPGVKAEEVEGEILKIIDLIKDGKIQDEEIEKVKTTTKADFIFSLESSSALANLFGSYLARGDILPLLNYEKDINNITKEELVKVAKTYFNKKSSTTLILRKENHE